MTGRALSALAVPAALVLAGAALAGNESRFEAFALTADRFEVVADFSEDDIYWCGAATFAARSLSQTGSARLYVWQGPAPSTARPGAVAVTFSLRPPPGGAVDSLTADVDRVGTTLTLVAARQACLNRSVSG